MYLSYCFSDLILIAKHAQRNYFIETSPIYYKRNEVYLHASESMKLRLLSILEK